MGNQMMTKKYSKFLITVINKTTISIISPSDILWKPQKDNFCSSNPSLILSNKRKIWVGHIYNIVYVFLRTNYIFIL